VASLWPWFALAGIGALHGLNPATGWMLAAACGVRARDRQQALRALLPIAIGHVASIAAVAAAVALGAGLDRAPLHAGAVAGFIVIAALHVARRKAHATAAHTGRTALALCSFMTTTAHGAGLMLLPALIPICLADTPAREITASGSLGLAMAAVAVHTAAMLAVTGAVACGACRGWDSVARRLRCG
jgi:hypothetical protein